LPVFAGNLPFSMPLLGLQPAKPIKKRSTLVGWSKTTPLRLTSGYNGCLRKHKVTNAGKDYYYSSARFYDNGIDEFGFLNNLFNEFEG
jgi:hypothetical protein